VVTFKSSGISRIGSGSHLMAMVLAEEHEWSVDKNDLKFVVKNDFVGLCNGTHQRNHFVIVFFECIRQ
jgi:hypothetical protein